MASSSGPAGASPHFCPRCGATLPMEGRFCGNCGHVLEAPSAAQPSSPAAARRPDPAFAQTAAPFPAMSPAPAPQSNPNAATAISPPMAAPPVASHRAPMRTMMGVAAMPGASAMQPAIPAMPANPMPAPSGVVQRALESAPAAAPVVFNAHKTMMGLVLPPSGPAAIPNAAAPGFGVANAQSTMMGVTSPIVPVPAVRPRGEAPPMIGGLSPGVAPSADRAPFGAQTQLLSSAAADALDEYDPLGRNKKRSASGSRTGLWVGIGLMLAAGAAGAIWYALRPVDTATTPPLQAEVASTDNGGLSMSVTIPGQPAGTVVRYGHQQQTLDPQGHARFTLDDLGTRVGAIDLPLDITPPNATGSRRTARIVLAYRVDPELGGLSAEPPTVRLLFHVVHGAQLRIDNQSIATDAAGAGVATLENVGPLAIDGPAVHEQVLHVQVNAPDGTQATGTYTLRVPRTALAIERPIGTTMLTTSERLVVRGQAPGAVRVTVNTAPATVTNGTFETVIALPGPGHVPIDIVAFSTTAAPARAHLDIDRVAPTDTAALDAFVATETGTVADLAAGSLSTGKHIRLTGRVLGAPREYEGGQTFQLIVNDRACPAGRCIAWVDVEPSQTPALNANVEIVGIVSGRRTSVTAGGEHRSDPVIHASAVR